MGNAIDNVRAIYMEGIAGGNACEAVHKYTGHRYTQHSTGVRDGAEGFLAFFEPFVARNPKREIEIVRIFKDGLWVFCNAFQFLNDGEAQWVTMDLFYTDANGLILEHWDTIAPYAKQTLSGEDMVGGTRDVDPACDSAASKAVILEFTKQVLQEGRHAQIADFVANDIIQHADGIDGGLDGLATWLKSGAAGSYEMLFQLICEGDFVMTYGKRHACGKDIAVFDLYRVAGGKIVEHWMNSE